MKLDLAPTRPLATALLTGAALLQGGTALAQSAQPGGGGYVHNVSGARGPKFGDNDLEAATLSLHAGANLPLGGDFVLSPSVSCTHATRENTDRWTQPTRPTVGVDPAMPDMQLPSGTVPTVLNSHDRSFSR